MNNLILLFIAFGRCSLVTQSTPSLCGKKNPACPTDTWLAVRSEQGDRKTGVFVGHGGGGGALEGWASLFWAGQVGVGDKRHAERHRVGPAVGDVLLR